MPRVDIVVPCHNYGHFLEACVQSALAQKGVDVRIIVIDDKSTDRSASVAESLARRDSRVQLISLSENVGMIRAVNVGLREIEGDYFVKLDADDLLPPGSLARSVALLERHPKIGFVYGLVRHFTGGVPPRFYPRTWLTVLGRPPWTVWQGDEWLALRYRRAVNCIRQPEIVIRTSTLRKVGVYNVALPHTSDLEMLLRLAAVSDVGHINRTVQGYYRVHPNSMVRTVNAGLLTDLIGRRDAFLSALSAVRTRSSGATDLEAVVRQKLAEDALEWACCAFPSDEVGSTDDLIEFATATFPASYTLPVWRRIEQLQKHGPRSRWSSPRSLAASLLFRSRKEFSYYRWVRTGV
jgi:GT2 family glycosyltransferase